MALDQGTQVKEKENFMQQNPSLQYHVWSSITS